MFHKHHSYFPIVILTLTLLLVAVMYFSFFSGGERVEQTVPDNSDQVIEIMTEPQEVVSAEDYQKDLKEIMSEFNSEFTKTENDFAKVDLIDKTLSSVLNLTVPAEYQDVHLEIATSLNLMRQGLQNSSDEFVNGQGRLNEVYENNSWLK